jgi:hypothetical protein
MIICDYNHSMSNRLFAIFIFYTTILTSSICTHNLELLTLYSRVGGGGLGKRVV